LHRHSFRENIEVIHESFFAEEEEEIKAYRKGNVAKSKRELT